jgi:DNA polymerase elongation subunit (family B)
MLDVLASAPDAAGFRRRIPKALAVAHAAAMRLRRGGVDVHDLGLMVQARMDVDDYQANTATRNALARLRTQGTERKPGQYVKYVVTRRTGPGASRATPIELLGEQGPLGTRGHAYDTGFYLRLLARSVETLLAPFGYTEDAVFAWLAGTAPSPVAPRHRALTRPARPAFTAA